MSILVRNLAAETRRKLREVEEQIEREAEAAAAAGEDLDPILREAAREAIPPTAGSMPADYEEKGLERRREEDGSVLKLYAVQREIARLAASGMKQQEICRALGVSTSMVHTALRKNPLVREQVAILQGRRDAQTADMNRRLQALQPVALEVLENVLLESPEIVGHKLQVEVSKTILDRGGNSAIQKSDHRVAFFSPKDMATINQRAEALRKGEPLPPEALEAPDDTEEIDYEEVS